MVSLSGSIDYALNKNLEDTSLNKNLEDPIPNKNLEDTTNRYTTKYVFQLLSVLYVF